MKILQYTLIEQSIFQVNYIKIFYSNFLRLWVMRLILNIIFSGVIVILAYKLVITFRFTLWLLSVMNKSIKD